MTFVPGFQNEDLMIDNKKKITRLARNIKADPDDTFSKFALALELIKNNEVEKALILFESVYRQKPDYVGVYYHLGKLYQSMGLYSRAEEIFEEGIPVAEKQDAGRTAEELKDALQALIEDRNYEKN